MHTPRPKRVIKGVSEIRTLAGRMGGKLRPHEAHLRVAALEMEKTRRLAEKDAAQERINSINARLQEINEEVAALAKSSLQHLATEAAASSKIRPKAKPEESQGPESRPATEGNGGRPFRIRY